MTKTAVRRNWYYILLALADGPRHGQAISREVERFTDGATRLWPATLYGALDALQDLGWLEEMGPDDRRPDLNARRRYFALTLRGRASLTEETRRLEDLVRIAHAARHRASR
jgi:DNA-binding PadR family transcriptional regulator